MYRNSGRESDRAKLLMGENKISSHKISSAESKDRQVRLKKSGRRSAFQRAESFEHDYPVFLLTLASTVRTGLDPLSALIEVRKLFDEKSELRQELEIFRDAVESGKNEAEAIGEFGRSINHPDIALFRTGYLLARQEGSSLAECLQRLARITRHRQSFRRKIKSAVAMQKLSAFGIGGCAVLICLIQAAGNPRMISDALNNPLGLRLLGLGGCLILSGLFWMVKMTKARI